MAPLVVKDFEWHQSHEFIFLSAKIKGIKAAKTSIVSSSEYLRVNFSPYLMEIFFNRDVIDLTSSCTIDEDEEMIRFQFPKMNRGIEWERLQSDLTSLEKKTIKENAVTLNQKREGEELESRSKNRYEQRQMTIKEQIRLDQEEKKRIASLKEFEGGKALREFDKWKQSSRFEDYDSDDNQELWNGKEPGDLALENAEKGSKDEKKEENPSSSIPIPNVNQLEAPIVCERKDPLENPNKDNKELVQIWSKEEVPICRSNNGSGEGNLENELPPIPSKKMIGNKNVVVPIRSSGQIFVSFTPREFSTPSRESREPEEQEWLKKLAEAKKLSGFDDQDLRPEEKDPTWLLEKGRSLMQAGTFLGALSALTLGIKLAPKMHELYMERAETHLNSKNYCKTIEDSSHALELLTPKVSSNAVDRLRCHLLRGEGFLGIHMKKEGVLDFKEASKLDPNSTKIQDTIRGIEAALERVSSDEDSDAGP